MSIEKDAVWLITGAASGFGLALARKALASGLRVAATARDPARLAALAERHPGRVEIIALDVANAGESEAAIARTVARFGRLDALVNNAGYGYFAAIEEGRDSDIQRLFEVNVFGLARLTRLALPHFRRQRSGLVVNLSSIGGLAANPGVGYYAASKFAVEALSEALAKEVAPFGVRVLIVEPGPFRTDFFSRSLASAPAHPDYIGTPARLQIEALLALGEEAKGDPDKAADAIFEALRAEAPPLRLLLGRRAYARALARLDAERSAFQAWEDLSTRADPTPPPAS